jgi:hypothetical protein
VRLCCLIQSIYLLTLPLTRTSALYALVISGLSPRDSTTNAPSTMKMDPLDCLETSVRNYHNSLHNNTEERSSHALRGGSLKRTGSVTARLVRWCVQTQSFVLPCVKWKKALSIRKKRLNRSGHVEKSRLCLSLLVLLDTRHYSLNTCLITNFWTNIIPTLEELCGLALYH